MRKYAASLKPFYGKRENEALTHDLQKVIFYFVKDNLSHHKRLPFGTQNTVFCNALEIKLLARRLISEEHYQHISPVGYHTGGYAAYGMRHYRLGRKLAVAQRVEHGGVRAEVSAPAHADGGEHGYGVAVNPSGVHETGNKPERGHSGQVEQRAHERAEQLLEQADDAELDEEAAYGARDDADAHKVEHGVEQQVVGGFHNSVEHVGHAHD